MNTNTLKKNRKLKKRKFAMRENQVTPRQMELLLQAAKGGNLLMRSLAAQPLAFFNPPHPLYTNSSSFAIIAASPLFLPPPGSDGDNSSMHSHDTKPQPYLRESIFLLMRSFFAFFNPPHPLYTNSSSFAIITVSPLFLPPQDGD